MIKAVVAAVIAVIGLVSAWLGFNLLVIYATEQDDHVAEVEK